MAARHRRLGAGAATLATAALAVSAWGRQEAPVSAPRLLYPPDGAIVTAGQVVVVALAPARAKPRIALDGKPLPTRSMPLVGLWLQRGLSGEDRTGKAAWAAAAALKPGPHTLAAGASVARIRRVTLSAVPKGQEPYRVHAPFGDPTSCAACHAPETDSPGGLSPARVPSACTTCHREADLPVIHRHVMDPFRRCYLCHDPHGGSRPKLLRDAREKLCVRCHEAGHSKG